jgi:hypothetical protein
VACKKASTNEDQDDDDNEDGARMSSSECRREKRAHVNVVKLTRFGRVCTSS